MMAVNKVTTKKGRGRPRKEDPIRAVVSVALSSAQTKYLAQWMKANSVKSRSEAIRKLMDLGWADEAINGKRKK